MGLNGGDLFKFNEAVSFVISCNDQEEIDYYWNNLIANGGSEGNCGWCKDKYGLSWQVVPAILGELMSNPDKGQRVIQAFLKMKKFDIEILKNA
jgi:predicted 3-demethylubiquinone-9 3-methyltransferase (glyoxalase superfamily)